MYFHLPNSIDNEVNNCRCISHIVFFVAFPSYLWFDSNKKRKVNQRCREERCTWNNNNKKSRKNPGDKGVWACVVYFPTKQQQNNFSYGTKVLVLHCRLLLFGEFISIWIFVFLNAKKIWTCWWWCSTTGSLLYDYAC